MRFAATAALVGLAATCACAGPTPPPAPPSSRSAPLPLELAVGSYGPEPAAHLTSLERAIADASLPRLRAPALRLSPALVLAAREMARGASSGADPRSRVGLRTALAAGLSFDPAPSMHFAEGSAASVATALASTLSPASSATHFGVGAVARDGRAFAVLLLARRGAALRPFPRQVATGATASLDGELLDLEAASVHVTDPSGESRRVSTTRRGRTFHTSLGFDAPGLWLVEVVGEGSRGPQVAALLTVSCGGAPLQLPAAAPDEVDPPGQREAEAAVIAAINATRRRHGVAPLAPSAALSGVARRHSDAMLAAGAVAHVLPGSGSVEDRLRRARIGYRSAFENVARGASALDAHRVIEESPAHRENVLALGASEVGCGIARGRLPGGEPIVYLTEVFVEPIDDGAHDHRTPDTLVRVALWAARSRARAPALTSDPRLDALAREAARRMLKRGEPGTAGLAEQALEFGRRLAAADAFVAASPAEATRSRNLPDRRFRRVGVGVAIGDNPKYGKGFLWIAVIYTN
jgi:uncharacterized protein YkwD